MNVHAKVVVDGRDRSAASNIGLERLCRYVARPPISQDRLELQGDGRVRLRFKAAWKDGTHAVVLDPLRARGGQDAAATRLDEALDAAEGTGIGVDRILRLAESWLRQLEEAIDEGRLKPDLADLERLLRVIREAKAEPDERAGIPEGMPTLDDLQRLYAENERRAREETPAMQGRLPHGTIPISWVQANEAQLRAKLAALEAKGGG